MFLGSTGVREAAVLSFMQQSGVCARAGLEDDFRQLEVAV